MVFDRESIKRRLDPKLNVFCGNELAEYITANHVIHNHYTLSLDFAKTEFFKKVKKTLPNKIFTWEEALITYEGVKEELVQINENLLKNNKLDNSSLYQVLDGLARHMCALDKNNPDHFRFGIDKWRTEEVINTQLDRLASSLEVINTIEKNLDKPDIGGFKYKYWNDLMTDIWACAYTGLFPEALYCLNILEKLIIKLTEEEGENPVFPLVLDQGTNARFLMSVYMLRTKIYVAQGKIDLAIKDYETIASYYEFDPLNLSNRPYKIWWFTGLNRVTEAAIEIYKFNPTEENKQRCIEYYINCCKFGPYDNTESTRERGLITYMLMKYVLDIEIK